MLKQVVQRGLKVGPSLETFNQSQVGWGAGQPDVKVSLFMAGELD